MSQLASAFSEVTEEHLTASQTQAFNIHLHPHFSY